MKYRLNYGNGQVSETFSTYAAARDAFVAQVRFDHQTGNSSGDLRIETYAGDGEWIDIGKAGRPRVEDT